MTLIIIQSRDRIKVGKELSNSGKRRVKTFSNPDAQKFLSDYRLADSISSKAFFRSRPQRYPPRSPLDRSTRWHGIAIATGLVAHARATARTAEGCRMAFATSV